MLTRMLRRRTSGAKIAPNVVVKVPLIVEGLKAVKQLTEEGIKTNVTLCFSSLQASAGGQSRRDVHLAVRRAALDDIRREGMERRHGNGIVEHSRDIYDNYRFRDADPDGAVRAARCTSAMPRWPVPMW